MIDCADVTSVETPPKKRPRFSPVLTEEKEATDCTALDNSDLYHPEKMSLVSVLQNDSSSKCIILHTRLPTTAKPDAIVILQKSPFPNNPVELQRLGVVGSCVSNNEALEEKASNTNSTWKATSVVDNDVYHRWLVTAGLEHVNTVDMTIVHPAEAHHFARYAGSGRHVIHETAEMYTKITVPFLADKPRDLAWVDNILKGNAEQDRVLSCAQYSSPSEFTCVLDYRWDGKRLQEMHCLGIVHDVDLTCLRDLRATHLPMLKHLLAYCKACLLAKYGKSSEDVCDSKAANTLQEDQILAYFHYPPTFYRLHVHFIHINASANAGTQAGRAHLADEVIRNLEVDSDYYNKRTMTVFLHTNSPMLKAFEKQCATSDDTPKS